MTRSLTVLAVGVRDAHLNLRVLESRWGLDYISKDDPPAWMIQVGVVER